MHLYHHPLFVQFIVYFNNNQDYFECHEVLEEYWKSIPDSDKKHPLAAYILLATGMYHWRRGNFTGAIRTLQKVEKKLPSFSAYYAEEIDFQQLVAHVKYTVESVKKELPFESFPLTITSATLQAHIEVEQQSMILLPFGSESVIHKHKLRDRRDILHERDEKKKGRH
jgi:predicted metal-dependent hydrolase